jgi:hypothetical protein
MIEQNSAALNPEVLTPERGLRTVGLNAEGLGGREGARPESLRAVGDGANPNGPGPDDLGLDVGPMHWTGRMEFDLSDAQGYRIGTVEIVIRIDHLSLWLGNRTLAVMDRDLFREWLIDPEEPFGIDDVTWSMDDVGTLLTIDESATYAIPNPVVQHLVQVV